MAFSHYAPVFAALALYLVFLLSKPRHMPPGPKGLPWLGNNHQMPAAKPWRKFTEWGRQYGPVISLWLGSTPVIVLSTADAAWDLLEKRSEIYSSRPRFVVAGEILSQNMRGVMLPYGERWRRWRKVLHTGFHGRKAQTYKPVQTLESAILMHDLLHDPNSQGWERNIQRFAASVVTTVTYGIRVKSMEEWIVVENVKAMDYMMSVNIPGKYLVEAWPWMLKLPRFLQPFLKEPEAQRQRDIKLYTHLLNDVKRRINDGSCKECLAKDLVEQGEAKSGLSEILQAYAVGSPFGAGIETTAGTLSSFVLAMLHHPAVMRTAQAELDVVVGPNRLPDFEDQVNLHYVRAVCNETLRWKPIAILGGTPHAATASDVYNGMFIPKGANIFANMDAIMQDPGLFPNPDIYRPERFIETKEPRLQQFELPFGFGRRICPGRHLASNSIFLNIARILWAFNLEPPTDQDGVPIIPDSKDFTDGFNSRPRSFRCIFTPRSANVKDVIEREWAEAQALLEEWA